MSPSVLFMCRPCFDFLFKVLWLFEVVGEEAGVNPRKIISSVNDKLLARNAAPRPPGFFKLFWNHFLKVLLWMTQLVFTQCIGGFWCHFPLKLQIWHPVYIHSVIIYMTWSIWITFSNSISSKRTDQEWGFFILRGFPACLRTRFQ